jgi:hypothetical protein
VYAICSYLYFIYEEAAKRGYKYSVDKIVMKRLVMENSIIIVSNGQIQYEFDHLKSKLKIRDPEWLMKIQNVETPEVHPLFKSIEGAVESWEKVNRSRQGMKKAIIPAMDQLPGGEVNFGGRFRLFLEGLG